MVGDIFFKRINDFRIVNMKEIMKDKKCKGKQRTNRIKK